MAYNSRICRQKCACWISRESQRMKNCIFLDISSMYGQTALSGDNFVAQIYAQSDKPVWATAFFSTCTVENFPGEGVLHEKLLPPLGKGRSGGVDNTERYFCRPLSTTPAPSFINHPQPLLSKEGG